MKSTDKLGFALKKDNLVPVYLLQDNLKFNFQNIQSFMESQNQINRNLEQKDAELSKSLVQIDKKYTSKFPELQKTIFNNIKQQIQATVSVIMNRQLSTLVQKLKQSEEKEAEKELQMKKKLSELQKNLSYQISQQNQKYFTKQIARIQKQIDKKIQVSSQKNKSFKGATNQGKKIQEKLENTGQKDKSISLPSNKSEGNTFSEGISKQTFQQLVKKIQKLQEFSTSMDKRFVTNFSSLKQQWKQLGSELLDNKKILTKKADDLNIEFIKIKNLTEFNNMPQTMEDSFKRKIMQKFTDILKITSTLATKNQFQMVNDRNKKVLARHTEQLLQVRQQIAKNNQFFTLFMNNSDSDDLNQKIIQIKSDMVNDKKYVDSMFQDIVSRSQKLKKQIQFIAESIGSIQITNENTGQKLEKINVQIVSMEGKIHRLDDLNDINPTKMKKIHETLDLEHNFGQNKSSLNQVHKISTDNVQMNKQIKKQIQKLKDQLFVITSSKNINGSIEPDEVQEIRAELKKLNKKLDRVRNQSEEAIISRKPWICISCDKQKIKQKTKEQFLQRDTSKKKLAMEAGKGGGFLTNRSEKSIPYKLSSPMGQQKFQVYEKYRQKYLSDTLKLPEIFKQKLEGEDLNLR